MWIKKNFSKYVISEFKEISFHYIKTQAKKR